MESKIGCAIHSKVMKRGGRPGDQLAGMVREVLQGLLVFLGPEDEQQGFPRRGSQGVEIHECVQLNFPIAPDPCAELRHFDAAIGVPGSGGREEAKEVTEVDSLSDPDAIGIDESGPGLGLGRDSFVASRRQGDGSLQDHGRLRPEVGVVAEAERIDIACSGLFEDGVNLLEELLVSAEPFGEGSNFPGRLDNREAQPGLFDRPISNEDLKRNRFGFWPAPGIGVDFHDRAGEEMPSPLDLHAEAPRHPAQASSRAPMEMPSARAVWTTLPSGGTGRILPTAALSQTGTMSGGWSAAI